MANPSFTSINSGNGNSTLANILSYNSNVLSNPNNSNLIYKIDSIFVNNYSTTATVNVYISVFGTSGIFTIATAKLTPETHSVIVSKDMMMYIQETQSLAIRTSSNNVVHAAINYEIIS